MKFDELQYFFEICKCKSFNQAAKNLYLSRQSLVRSITNLENELNMQLFSRGYTGVELTSFGEMFYEKAYPAYVLFGELQELPGQYAKMNNRHITIGIRGKFRSAFAVYQFLDYFRKDHPDILVEVVDCADISSSVEEKQLDFGFTLRSEQFSPQITYLECIAMEQKLLINRRHRLAKAGAVTADMLLGEKVMIASYSEHPYYLLREFTSESYMPEVLFATVDMGLVFDQVHRCPYIAGMLLDRDAELGLKLYDDLVVRSFSPSVNLSMGLIYRSDVRLSPQKKIFLQYFQEKFHASLPYQHAYHSDHSG